MRVIFWILLLVPFLGVAGCDDDDSPVRPEPFRVVLTVTDPGGRPVQGLELGVAPHTPAYGERADAPAVPEDDGIQPPWPSPFWPSCIIGFQVRAPADVRLWIEDVEGTEVALLADGPTQPGRFERQWNGLDRGGRALPSGVYRAHLRLKDTLSDLVYFQGRQPMLRGAFFADQYRVGTTDADGRIVIDDERLFPALYGVTELPQTNETGEIVGRITLGPATRFSLTDPVTDTTASYVRDVDGPVELDLTWDPAG